MYQRQKKILDMLQRGKVSIPSAAAELGVTEMTVRRDLKELEKRKLALLVKGGAIPFPARYEPEENELEHLERKNAIADVLFLRILPADSIFLSTGSTTLAFARVLARRNTRPMTVITNSLMAAADLMEKNVRLILVGGEFRRLSRTMVGPLTAKILENVTISKAFLGTIGFEVERGISTTDTNEAFTKELVAKRAEKVFLLADSSKVGSSSFVYSGDAGDIDILITDTGITSGALQALKNRNIEVYTV